MPQSCLKRRQLLSFGVAWWAYASTYLLRKPLGVIKSDLQHAFDFQETQLGWFDTALLFPYATVQLLLGSSADHYGPRITLTICLTVSSLAMIGFGMVRHFYLFFILLFINGGGLSLTWPCVVKVVGCWYPGQSLNTVMGILGTSGFAGGIVGAASAVYFQHEYGWNSVFFVPSLVVLTNAAAVYFLLSTPEEVLVNGTGKQSGGKGDADTQSKPETLKWIDVWRIPGVLDIALAMLFLKIVRYCMYMWLPMYLFEKNGYSKSEAGLFSTIFEVGGLFGSVSIGFMIDKYFKGHSLVGTTVFAFLSAFTMGLFFWTSSKGLFLNTVFLLLTGAFSCGPDSMLGSSISMELGEAHGVNSGSAVVGLVNGLGSIGTFLEGPLIGLIVNIWSWDGMAIALVLLSFLGSFYCWKATTASQSSPTL